MFRARTRMAKQTSRLFVEMEKVRELLEAEAAEAGSLDGLHALEQTFLGTVNARLRAASDDLRRLGPEPSTLAEQRARLEHQFTEAISRARQYRAEHELPPRVGPAIQGGLWLRPVSVGMTGLITGLVLAVTGVPMDSMRWALLGAMTVLVALNHLRFHAVVGHLRDYYDYRRSVAKARRLERHIDRVREEAEAEIRRRDWVDQWVAGRENVVANLYKMHRERGETAARLRVLPSVV